MNKKANKRIFLLVLILCMSVIFTGCKDNTSNIEGVTTKKFQKDLNSLAKIIAKSASEQEYNEKEINEIVEKMNETSYKNKLTSQELVLLENLNESLKDLKIDLTTGEKIMDGYTFDNMKWFLQPEN